MVTPFLFKSLIQNLTEKVIGRSIGTLILRPIVSWCSLKEEIQLIDEIKMLTKQGSVELHLFGQPLHSGSIERFSLTYYHN